jgi:hypothetical protein
LQGDSATLLTTQLIGPFHVAFDTPDFVNPGGAPLDLGVALPTGTMVLRALVFVTEAFGDPLLTDGLEYIEVTVGVGANLIGQWAAAAGVDANINIEAVARYVADNPQFLPYAISRAAFAIEDDTPLQAACWASATPTAGQADIYAIIATPAS